MIVDLSPPEKGAVAFLMRGMAWGGTPELLLAQGGLYDKLGLSAFEGDGVPAVPSEPVDLTTDETTVLTAVVSMKGQDFETSRQTLAILRRIT